MWTSDRALFIYFGIIMLVLFMWLISWAAEKKDIEFENRNCQPTNYFAETRNGWLSPVYKCEVQPQEKGDE